jgi:hypothetical protein
MLCSIPEAFWTFSGIGLFFLFMFGGLALCIWAKGK